MLPDSNDLVFGAVNHANGTTPADNEVERDPDADDAETADDVEADRRPSDRRAYPPFL